MKERVYRYNLKSRFFGKEGSQFGSIEGAKAKNTSDSEESSGYPSPTEIDFSGGFGLVVGADLSQEWLLPWWYSHYTQHNAYPIAFADFGMSREMQSWCRERGEWISIADAPHFVTEKEEMESKLVEKMERECGREFWASRSAWFKKPLACMRSPFKRTLWVDLDCQICGSLAPLFSLTVESIAMARDHEISARKIPVYNSGVIRFDQGNRVIAQWAKAAVEQNHLFRGDQDVLNALIAEKGIGVTEIPEIFNWSRMKEKNLSAVVLHWHGPHGKSVISHQMAVANLQGVFGS